MKLHQRFDFKKLLTLFFIGAAVVILSGCASDSMLVKQKTILIVPPDSLLLTTPMVPPPDFSTYIKKPPVEQEVLMREAFSQCMSALNSCNVNTNSIRDWVAEHKNMEEGTDNEPKRTGNNNGKGN